MCIHTFVIRVYLDTVIYRKVAMMHTIYHIVYIYMYIYNYVCIYIYIYREREIIIYT